MNESLLFAYRKAGTVPFGWELAFQSVRLYKLSRAFLLVKKRLNMPLSLLRVLGGGECFQGYRQLFSFVVCDTKSLKCRQETNLNNLH